MTYQNELECDDINNSLFLRNIANSYNSLNHNSNTYVAKAIVEGLEAGDGVFAKSVIAKHEYICLYQGTTLCHGPANTPIDSILNNQTFNSSYNLFYTNDKKLYSIDSSDKKYLCAYINHSRKLANVFARKLNFNNMPLIFMFASRMIKKDEQILFDYGDRDSDLDFMQN
jgi:SET domain-containing protein